MPGKKKGNKKKTVAPETRQILYKEDDQEYARVLKALGNARYLLSMNVTGKEVLGKLRGTMRRRRGANWVGVDAVVLTSIRDFQTGSEEKMDCVDILHVYKSEEVKKLKKEQEFVENARAGVVHKEDQEEEDPEDAEELGFDFDDI